MKNVRLVGAALIALLLVSSCGMMNGGFSGNSIQKRKYTDGFYFNKNKKFKGAEKDEADVKEVNSQTNDESKIEAVANDQVPFSKEQIQKPTDQNTSVPVQKDEEKVKEQKRKPTAPAKKNQTPQKQRKERVPEHYLPIKKDAVVGKRQLINDSGSADDMFILAVIFAILIPPIGVAIYTNIDWVKVLICLLLTMLLFLPGMIYALLVVFDVI